MSAEDANPPFQYEAEGRSDLVYVTADVQQVVSLLEEFDSMFSPERIRYLDAAADIELVTSLRRDITAVNKLASLIASTALSREGKYAPVLTLLDRVRTDFDIVCSVTLARLDEYVEKRCQKIVQMAKEYIQKRRQGADDPELHRQLIEEYGRTVISVLMLYSALEVALYKIFSMRSISLPPEFRSPLVNMRVLGVDIIHSPMHAKIRQEMLRQVREEEERTRKLAQEIQSRMQTQQSRKRRSIFSIFRELAGGR